MNFKICALQCSLKDSETENLLKIEKFAREAKEKFDPHLLVLPELFQGPYFCKTEDENFFSTARSPENSESVHRIKKLAQELKLAINISFFEESHEAYYNSQVLAYSDGSLSDVYRKLHIPDGPGYEEKFYFRPGNQGFKVWDVQGVKIGAAICWDQWYPEMSRSLTLLGADVIIYPTAIGSEPETPELNTKDSWQTVMRGQSVANAVTIVAANRVGDEGGQVFYGSSFISSHTGSKIVEANEEEETILFAEIDVKAQKQYRASFGFFRDRRSDVYINE